MKPEEKKVKLPNKKTRKTLEATDHGEELTEYESSDEMFKDLKR